MSLGARDSKRSRSQSPGLLFRGDRQGVVAPVRQDGGGAETRRAARNERKQKTAVLQGAARPQAVQRSRARETRRQKKRGPDACRNRVSAPESWLSREEAPGDNQAVVGNQNRSGEIGLLGEKSKDYWSAWASLQEAPRGKINAYGRSIITRASVQVMAARSTEFAVTGQRRSRRQRRKSAHQRCGAL